MAAIIRTYLNGDLSTVIEGASREDLRPGDVVHCEAVEGAMTGEGYRWTLAFTPDSLDGTPSASTLTSELDSTTTFTVDNEGAYLLRLVTDPNTKHESTQFVRLRFLTKFGSLKLVAAGERRDGTGIVPVDVSTEGWANDQNYNLQELLKHISRTAISSRVLYVDANRGNDNSHAQNTEEAEGYGDFWKIQDAIDEAVSGSHCGVPAASETPWMIIIRPGRYVENLTIPPGIHLIGSPTGGLNSEHIIETVGNGAAHKISGAGEVFLSGLYFHSDDNTLADPILHVEDTTVIMNRVAVQNTSAAASAPAAISCGQDSSVEAHDCYFAKGVAGADDEAVVEVWEASFSAWKCKIEGRSCVLGQADDAEIKIHHSKLVGESNSALYATVWGKGDFVISDSNVKQIGAGGHAIYLNGIPTAQTARLEVRRSKINQTLKYNPGLTSPKLLLASVEIPDDKLDFDTSASWFSSATTGESIYFNADKTPLGSSLLAGQLDSSVAGNIQEAVDRALALALSVVTLGDAYNGVTDHTGHPFVRGDGAGNRIVADAVDEFGVGIPVQITDSDAPGAEAGIGETKGRLQVVSNVEVGAVDAPEIIANPNPYGLGPVLSMGRTVWDASHFPAAVVEANTDSDTGRHYGLRLQTKSGDGGGEIGSVIIQAGDHTSAAQDGGSVHISAGAGNSGGDITFWPGFLAGGGDAGKILLLGGGHRNQDPTLTAPDAFAGGVAGTVVFGSAITGTFTLEIATTTTLNEICTSISSTTPLTGINDGGKLAIQVSDKSLKAEPFIVSVSSPELNTALGDLLNYTVVHADQAEFQFALQVPVDNEIHLGVDGAAGPMTYNSETGALSVPGAIAAASLETTGDLVVGGDLTVMGDSTIAYTSTVQVEDKNLELGTIEGGGETDATADGGGITIKGATDKTLVWDQATNAFSVNTNFTVPSGKIGVGLDGMATPEPQKTLYVHTENNGDGFLVENSHDGSKFLVDYSSGNGTNVQLHDNTNTRTIFVRSYGDSWFNAGNIGIGTESPSKLFHVETDSDGEGVFVGNTSNGSKFLVDYSMGNGINTQLFDETNTRTIFFRSYGNSWFVNTVSIGTDTPVAGKALTVDGDVAIDGDLDVTGTITASGIVGPVVQTHNIVSAIDYDAAADDYFIICDTDAAGGDIYVWLDPAIAAGRVLVIKNKGNTHAVSISTGSFAGGFSASSLIDDDPVCFLPPKEAVNLVCNGGEDWSIF